MIFLSNKKLAAFRLQIAAEGVFCCYNNSCNGSQVRCAAEMSDVEVPRLWERDIIRGRKLYGASNNLVQELRLDDARFHSTPCAPKLVRSVYRLSFSFSCYGNDSALACHWSAVKKALDIGRIFQKSLSFFNFKRSWRWHFKKLSGLFCKLGLLHRIII